MVENEPHLVSRVVVQVFGVGHHTNSSHKLLYTLPIAAIPDVLMLLVSAAESNVVLSSNTALILWCFGHRWYHSCCHYHYHTPSG